MMLWNDPSICFTFACNIIPIPTESARRVVMFFADKMMLPKIVAVGNAFVPGDYRFDGVELRRWNGLLAVAEMLEVGTSITPEDFMELIEAVRSNEWDKVMMLSFPRYVRRWALGYEQCWSTDTDREVREALRMLIYMLEPGDILEFTGSAVRLYKPAPIIPLVVDAYEEEGDTITLVSRIETDTGVTDVTEEVRAYWGNRKITVGKIQLEGRGVAITLQKPG